jgi:arylsulfatase A-like enzyme
MLETHQNRHTAYYADKELPSFPREPVHPWLKANRDIINNPVSIRGYAAAISGIDDGVGEILDALAGYGLDENTLVIFTADQGLCGGHHGMWGMGDHSLPLHTFEEAIHIPLFFRHTGSIPAGRIFEERTCNYDFFPTMLDYLELTEKLPDEPELPGTSYSRALLGDEIDWNDFIFHEFENTRMIRSDRWKYTQRHPNGPDELYDMQNDPGERTNLAGDLQYIPVIEELRTQLDEFFDRYADPEYDLWRDGSSKAGRMIRPD